MSLELKLPPELAAALSTEADELGLTLEEYALRLLAQGRARDTSAQSGAELVAYWKKKGLIGLRPDIDDAPTHARTLRDQAQKRARY